VHVNCSQSGSFTASIRTKLQENFFSIFILKEAEEAKIWWNPQVQHQTRSLALKDCGSHCNQEELEDTNEVEGQTKTSASHMKLLESGNDSETSTMKESSADVDLEISSFGFTRHGFKTVWKMKKPNLEQHNTNAANKIF